MLIFLILTLIIWISVKKKRLYNIPLIFSLINSIAYFIYFLSYNYGLNYVFGFATRMYHIIEYEYIYFFYFFLNLISLIVLLITEKGNKIDFNAYKFKISFRSVYLLSIIIFLSLFFHFLDIDKTKLLYHKQYLLLIYSNEAGLSSFFTILVHKASGFIGVFSAVLFHYSAKMKYSLPKFLFLISTLYALVLKLAINSRWAGLIIASLLLSKIFIYNKSKHKFRIVFSIVIIFLIYATVLSGRQKSQGILSIGSNLITATSNIGTLLNKSVFNVFAGAVNLSIAFDQEVHYPRNYKIVSFSPLISKLDNYDDLANRYQVRINRFVPYNYYTELIKFGNPYIFLFFLFLFILFYNIEKVRNKNFITYLSLSVILIIAFFMMQQYPIRNIQRFMYLVLIITFFKK